MWLLFGWFGLLALGLAWLLGRNYGIRYAVRQDFVLRAFAEGSKATARAMALKCKVANPPPCIAAIITQEAHEVRNALAVLYEKKEKSS
jgi:hypothetical protein